MTTIVPCRFAELSSKSLAPLAEHGEFSSVLTIWWSLRRRWPECHGPFLPTGLRSGEGRLV
jgi:hypothetical protein